MKKIDFKKKQKINEKSPGKNGNAPFECKKKKFNFAIPEKL